jgi:hypothetical protein
MSPINFGLTRSHTKFQKRLYVPDVPTTNLYSHWDMNLLPVSNGTTFLSGTISGTNGTNIGAAPNTPSLKILQGSNGTTTTKPTAVLMNSGKLGLLIPYAFLSSTANYGYYVQSNSPAFPDGLNYWTYIVVWSTPSINTGFQRPYRFDVPGIFFYDDSHSSTWWWRYNLNGEVGIANIGTGSEWTSDGSAATRGYNTQIHVDIVTQNGNTVTAWSTNLTGTAVQCVTWTNSFHSAGSAGTRVFEIRPVTYTGYVIYPNIYLYEAATYNTVLNNTTISNTISALWNKWKLP